MITQGGPPVTSAETLRVPRSEACRLYHAALQEHLEAYATHRKSVNCCEQAAPLTQIRASGGPGTAELSLCSRRSSPSGNASIAGAIVAKAVNDAGKELLEG